MEFPGGDVVGNGFFGGGDGFADGGADAVEGFAGGKWLGVDVVVDRWEGGFHGLVGMNFNASLCRMRSEGIRNESCDGHHFFSIARLAF